MISPHHRVTVLTCVNAVPDTQNHPYCVDRGAKWS